MDKLIDFFPVHIFSYPYQGKGSFIQGIRFWGQIILKKLSWPSILNKIIRFLGKIKYFKKMSLPNKINYTFSNIHTLHSLANFIDWKCLIFPKNRIIFLLKIFNIEDQDIFFKIIWPQNRIPWVKLPLPW